MLIERPRCVSGARVLITGGTGSLGNQLVGAFLQSDAKEVIIFSRDEQKQDVMAHKYDDPRLRFVLGDIRDPASIDAAVLRSDVVINTAALKIIPILERNVEECVRTNITGASNVLNACVKHGIRAVTISTDKAVEPLNVYGACKKIQEHLFTSHGFNVVRYGNVVGSRGSVIPLFLKQRASNQPLTITHRDMTRYLLTLDDAMHLIFYALGHEPKGTIFIHDAPAATVGDIADVISPEQTVVGIRPGEKMHEKIIGFDEVPRTFACAAYLFIDREERAPVPEPDRFSSDKARRLTKPEIVALLAKCGYEV